MEKGGSREMIILQPLVKAALHVVYGPTSGNASCGFFLQVLIMHQWSKFGNSSRDSSASFIAPFTEQGLDIKTATVRTLATWQKPRKNDVLTAYKKRWVNSC